MENRVIKFRAWDGIRMTTSGIMFNTSTGQLETPTTASISGNPVKYDLMQFTGLTDKNGKEIYEGDILRIPANDSWDEKNYSCFEVFFHDGDSNTDYNIGFTMGRMHNHGSVCGGAILPFKPKTVKKMVIIGNIYENPELWKTIK